MEIFFTSILTFVSSNIDDIFILTLFFGNKKFRDKEIVAGQFIGISSLIILSLAASLIGLVIDKSYIGLLGLVPIYLGLKAIYGLIKNYQKSLDLDDRPSKQSNILIVASVTFANGGDNIGIYVPLFAVMSWANKLSMVIIFLFMTGLWCVIAKYLNKNPLVSQKIQKFGHILTPIVLILLGVYILFENESIKLFINK
jgi:cadmium resistance protein CadD (predicted permease)